MDLKVFLSTSKSATSKKISQVRDNLKSSGCHVIEYNPLDPSEQMLCCDILVVVPPENCDSRICGITVGRGQYEGIERWLETKDAKSILVCNFAGVAFKFESITKNQSNSVDFRTNVGFIKVDGESVCTTILSELEKVAYKDVVKYVKCTSWSGDLHTAGKIYTVIDDIITDNYDNRHPFTCRSNFEPSIKEEYDAQFVDLVWYKSLKVGDKVKCIANKQGYHSRKIGEILTIDEDFSKCKKISFNGDSSTYFKEFELVSRLADEKPVDPKAALLERAINDYPIGTKFNSAASFLATGLHVKHTPKFNFAGNIGTRDNAENGIIYHAASGKWAEKIQEDVTPIKDLPLRQWYKKDGFIVHLYYKNSVWGFHNGQWFESEAFSEEGLVKISEYDTLSLFKAEILKRYPSKVFTDLCNSLDFEIKNESFSINNKGTQIYIPVKPNPARANASARIFDKGVWAKEVSVKPVEVTKSKFEVGKWYKYVAHTTNVWYIKYQKTDSNGIFIASEYIDNRRIYRNNLNNFTCGEANSEKVLLTDLSEIQQYLPEGHPDKIVVEKSNEFGYLVALKNDPNGVSSMKKGDIGICVNKKEFIFDSHNIEHLKGIIWNGNGEDCVEFKWFKTLDEAEAFARTLDSIPVSVGNQTFFINKDEYENQEVKHIKPFSDPTIVLSAEELMIQMEKMYNLEGLINPNSRKKKLLKISTII